MAIKRGSKVKADFSSASMTDLMFLLLIFMLVATTLINPNALKMLLPKSTNQLNEKPYTTVSITADLKYYVELEQVSFQDLEAALQAKVGDMEEPTFALHADKSVPWEQIVEVMNIAKENNYKMIAATQPN